MLQCTEKVSTPLSLRALSLVQIAEPDARLPERSAEDSNELILLADHLEERLNEISSQLPTGSRLLYLAISGSYGHGTNTEGSDIDIVGIYAGPVTSVLADLPSKSSIVTTSPDAQIHEVGKFISLAIKGNPSLLEMLWSPVYYCDPEFAMFRECREMFITQQMFNQYLGYCFAQVKHYRNKTHRWDYEQRKHKWVYHLVRCCMQAQMMLPGYTFLSDFRQSPAVRLGLKGFKTGTTGLDNLDQLSALLEGIKSESLKLPRNVNEADLRLWLMQFRCNQLIEVLNAQSN